MYEEKISYFGHSYEFINRVRELIENDEEFAIVEVISTEGPSSLKPGNKIIVKSDGNFEGWIGGFCTRDDIIRYSLEAIENGQIKYLSLNTCHGGIVHVYIEPLLSKKRLILVGNNPITHYVQKLGEMLGFIIIKLDSTNEIGNVKITRNTFAIVATMGEKDHEFAEALLNTGIKYIGVIAGKRRGEDLLSYLRNKGYKDDSLSRIKVPAGIDINATLPEEIALSVLAEVVKISNIRETNTRNVKEKTNEATDPVCGMSISTSVPYYSTFGSKVYYFCSKYCKDKFDGNPQIYVK
ncbi:YHS domain-containing protein [Saccharolobus solfataricus]|nr:YHS domain-containing protein [Saccharolobus solfataricus]AKA77810.1 YHS domain-containing protein [Saccharolobus solfataricus]AKA80504.1 YHS domain-containing protein [Saccharolobus solfataricus]AZF69562.1 YHS domain-containing protein [Saccharolobus solfataricus]AZF72182.1 YHS domain-containing protein [Saccharolobus solfataricus]